MTNKNAELIKRLLGFIPTPREAQTLCLEAANALESAAVPEGWKLVPIEPTDEQLQAGTCGKTKGDTFTLLGSYHAMLNAAPQPPEPASAKPLPGYAHFDEDGRIPQPPVSAKPLTEENKRLRSLLKDASRVFKLDSSALTLTEAIDTELREQP